MNGLLIWQNLDSWCGIHISNSIMSLVSHGHGVSNIKSCTHTQVPGFCRWQVTSRQSGEVQSILTLTAQLCCLVLNGIKYIWHTSINNVMIHAAVLQSVLQTRLVKYDINISSLIVHRSAAPFINCDSVSTRASNFIAKLTGRQNIRKVSYSLALLTLIR